MIFILLIRPLSQILPEFKILRTITSARRELGILCASLILGHTVGYYVKTKQFPHDLIFSPDFWQLDNFLVWGVLGSILSILLLITSNNIAVKILKGYWKKIQLSAYLLLLLSAIHIFLQKRFSVENFFESFGFVLLIIIIWFMAKKKIKFHILKPFYKN